MIAALLSLAIVSEAEALGDWVPPKLLAAALILLLGAGLTGGAFAVRALLNRLDKLETTVAHASTEIGRLANFATREQLTQQIAEARDSLTAGQGNMGNRFDERVAELRGEVTKLEIRMARLEERSQARRTKT